LLDTAIRPQFGNTIGLRIFDFLEHNLAVPVAARKIFNEAGNTAFNDVIAQKHDKAVVAKKIARNLDGVRQTIGTGLRNVFDIDAPTVAVAECAFDLGMSIAHDDADVVDAGVPDSFDDSDKYRLVGYGNQLFGLGISEWAKSGSLAATEYQPLHRSYSCSLISDSDL